MVKFREREIIKEKFYAVKRPINIWNNNVGNIIASKLA